MNERTKKQFITGLLLISCIFSGWLLFLTPSKEHKRLKNFAQIDSLLRLSLLDFNIPEQQLSTYTTPVDSIFSRATHTVKVPPAFSKTQFHAVLQRRLAPYKLQLPARITFPEKQMHIQFQYKGTIIRTLKLVTNKKLKMQRSFASLIVAFDGRPPDYLLEDLSSMGEPIAVAVIINQPLTIPDWWDDLRKRYSPIFIWPKTAGGNNLLNEMHNQPLSALKPFTENIPRTTFMSFFENEMPPSLKETFFSFVDASNALIFNDAMEETEFDQAFRTFVRQARTGSQPIAIVIANEATIDWTQKELNIFKKGGLFLTPPR